MTRDESEARVVQGDAFELLEGLPSNSAHCAVVDYPWQFDHTDGTGNVQSPTAEERGERGMRLADMFQMEPDEKFGDLLDELARVLVDGSWLFCFADDRFQETVRDMIGDSEFTFRRNWAWSTDQFSMGHYGRVNHWPIPTATLGETDRHVQDRGTLYRTTSKPTCEYPTAKPVGLYRHLLAEPVLKEGERLLEPFCGSAPGASVAAERGLGYWACDTETEAIERAKFRLSQSRLTQPTLEAMYDE